MKQRLYFGIPGGWRKVLQVVDDRIGFFERKKCHKMWKVGQKQDFLNLLKQLNECLYYLLYSGTNWAKMLFARLHFLKSSYIFKTN